MRRFLLVVFAVSVLSCSIRAEEEIRPRLVSLAPSITELVYALKAERFLAGTADGSIYPAEALALPRIGSFSDPDPDAVNALRPDTILVLEEHMPSRAFLDIVFATHVLMKHDTLNGILDSLTILGELCAMPYEAGKLRDELQASFALPLGYDETSAPSMLLLIGKHYGDIPTATAVGNDSLYSQLITAVGCKNAYIGNDQYPELTDEAIALINPDIIVEGIYVKPDAPAENAAALYDWLPLQKLDAAKNKAIFYIRTDYAFVPGMRMVLMKRDLENIVRRSEKLPAEMAKK